MIDTFERRLLDSLDPETIVTTATELITIRSLSGAETPAQEKMAALLEDAGCALDVWPIDFVSLSRHPSYSAEVDRREGLGVVGAFGEDVGGPTLMLNGHVDVVPAGDAARWTHPPWSGVRDGEWIYGRGSADMKGAMAVAVHVVRALKRADIRLRGRLLVASVIGEEDGGCGTLATLERGHRADGAVVMEPTALALLPAQAGAVNFRLSVPGQAAHGALRDEGVSALECFWPLHRALLELEREINSAARHPLFVGYSLPYPLSIGVIKAGDWPSSVPGRLTAEGRYGIAVDEDPKAAQRRFEAVIAAAARQHPWLAKNPPRVEFWGGHFPPAETPVDNPLIVALRGAVEEIEGAPARLAGAPYGSDLGLLVHQGGIPTVLFGPGDIRDAHRENERVRVDELARAARALLLLVVRYCGVL